MKTYIMNVMFDLPWIFFSVTALFLCVLFLRELFIFLHLSHAHPERGMACFNASILFGAMLIVFVSAHFLYTHVQSLERVIPAYPTGRYAPERELLTSGDFESTWIFVTKDSPDLVAQFYQAQASSGGYNLVVQASTSTTRLLFTKQEESLFLTIVKEGGNSMLHYSRDGKMVLVKTH